jgi:hypothetical protein
MNKPVKMWTTNWQEWWAQLRFKLSFASMNVNPDTPNYKLFTLSHSKILHHSLQLLYWHNWAWLCSRLLLQSPQGCNQPQAFAANKDLCEQNSQTGEGYWKQCLSAKPSSTKETWRTTNQRNYCHGLGTDTGIVDVRNQLLLNCNKDHCMHYINFLKATNSPRPNYIPQ